MIEDLGFDSVWARDHVVYAPHEFEDPDLTLIDPLVTLAAAAAGSTRLLLGTATLIPHRHPIHTALLLSSLAHIAGPERLVIGWGIGNDRREFAAVGAPGSHRGKRLDEHVEAVRSVLSGESVSHHGEHYEFEDVQVMPPGGHIEFWYGGGTPGGIRRAARLYDGLLASRVPRSILKERIAYLREQALDAGRPEPRIGTVMMANPARTVEEGLAAFDLERLHAEVARRFPERSWDRHSGFEGVMMAGPPDEIASDIQALGEIGVDHLVLDLRVCFETWEEVTAALSADVLPRIRRHHDG